ncbi:MAG: hypothetical protein GF335_02780 [Candidatus Moranbacteria bacterium]|nr:hypothetical protein [Candidatus Moranbacteria bacterium]
MINNKIYGPYDKIESETVLFCFKQKCTWGIDYQKTDAKYILIRDFSDS